MPVSQTPPEPSRASPRTPTGSPPEPLPRLTAAQAAARLGVKQATLYAYVSRGLLSRERTAAGSSFDPLEVEGFAWARRRDAAPTAPARTPVASTAAGGSPLMVLDTDVAEIADDELYYRGRPAAELIGQPLEEVAAWLWGGGAADNRAAGRGGAVPGAAAPGAPEQGPVAGGPTRAGAPAEASVHPEAVAAARALVAALPPGAALLDRIQAAVTGLAAADPLRYDATPQNLRRTGALLLAGIPRALAPVDPGPGVPVAAALWPAFAAGGAGDALAAGRGAAGTGPASAPSEPGIRALNAALVLLIDHDLAVSTLAARVAASGRASGYAVVTAALGALDAPLHGNASRAAAELLAHVVEGMPPEAALAVAVRDGARGVPGFGHPLYSGTDARAGTLLPLIAELDGATPVLTAVDTVSAQVRSRAGLHPNVDLALGALTLAAGLRHDAGVAIFAVGRLVGWIAHALDEYEQRPLRLRPRGRYVGP